VRRNNGLLLIAFVAGALAMLEIACHDSRDRARPRPPTTQLISERPLPSTAQPTLIKQGPSPLVYLVEGAGTLRFVDITANENELARALVQPRQIVRIDARRGVMLGETVLRPGPLPTDHTYGIWLEPDPSNYSTNSIVNPQPGRDTTHFETGR
jgi:hypothetical protein